MWIFIFIYTAFVMYDKYFCHKLCFKYMVLHLIATNCGKSIHNSLWRLPTNLLYQLGTLETLRYFVFDHNSYIHPMEEAFASGGTLRGGKIESENAFWPYTFVRHRIHLWNTYIFQPNSTNSLATSLCGLPRVF